MADLQIGRGIVIPASEISIRFSRAGGPGGQNVNKRDTRVEVLFDVGASMALSDTLKRRARSRLRNRIDAHGRVRVTSSAGRTQARNREAALERLALLLADALRPPAPPRRPTKPSAAARERRLETKRARSRTKRARRRPSAED